MQKIQVGVILTLAITVLFVSVFATTLLTSFQRVPNGGNVKAVGVGVYWDSACTNNVTSIDWGFLDPGQSANRTVYVKNHGNTPIVLNMTSENWTPSSARNYIIFSWNREGYVLNTTVPVVQVVLTLSVSSNISGITNFNFDIIITGTEQT